MSEYDTRNPEREHGRCGVVVGGSERDVVWGLGDAGVVHGSLQSDGKPAGLGRQGGGA